MAIKTPSKVAAMTTFSDDFIRLDLGHRSYNIKCEDLGIDWPPPPIMFVDGFLLRQLSCSEITDEERQDMTHVCRGALYSVTLIHEEHRTLQ